MMEKKYWMIRLLSLLVISACSSDDDQIVVEEQPKTYELQSIQWKLNENSKREIVEEKLPEFYFRNEADTVLPVVIKPLADLRGTSKFDFDSIPENFQYAEVRVSIPKELEILSDNYTYLVGGTMANLQEEESDFPFTTNFTTTFQLSPQTELTSNYTVYLKRNRADFLAIFREMDSGEILELEGSWAGTFLDGTNGDSVANDIK